MNKLFFTNKQMPNQHVEFNAHGVKVWVSLNIEPSMKKHLSPNNVFRAGKYWVYSLREQLNIVNINSLKQAQESLLNRLMINCREAKQKVLQEQIETLQNLHLFEDN